VDHLHNYIVREVCVGARRKDLDVRFHSLRWTLVSWCISKNLEESLRISLCHPSTGNSAQNMEPVFFYTQFGQGRINV
jgi:hypothetical protein